MLRGAAIVLAGVTAGCSSGAMRFSDVLSTASTENQRQILPQSQAYPGDQVAAVPSGTVTRNAMAPVSASGGAVASNNNLPPLSPNASEAPVGSRNASVAPVSASAPMSQPVSAPQVVASAPAAAASAASAAGQAIVVNPGDTLSSLSRRYGVSTQALMQANGIADANSLRSGQKLVMPGAGASAGATTVAAAQVPNRPMPAPAPANGAQALGTLPQTPKVAGQPASGGTYVVQAGDTLTKIAARTGVGVEALKSANNLQEGSIRVGQTLSLSGSPAAQVAAAPAKPAVDPAQATTVAKAESVPVKPAAYTPPQQSARSVVESDVEEAAPSGTGISRMRWPVRGRVIGGYGSGSGKAGDGIDIAVPAGTPVKAAENGVVIYAGDGLKEFGNTVLVRHEDGLVTVYGHASELKVSRGQTVKRGQELALSGATGSADSPKLHFEVRKNSAPVDPRTFLE